MARQMPFADSAARRGSERAHLVKWMGVEAFDVWTRRSSNSSAL